MQANVGCVGVVDTRCHGDHELSGGLVENVSGHSFAVQHCQYRVEVIAACDTRMVMQYTIIMYVDDCDKFMYLVISLVTQLSNIRIYTRILYLRLSRYS